MTITLTMKEDWEQWTEANCNSLQQPEPSLRLKPDTIARIHLAREILLAHLENPPSLLELAQIIGVSDRTLQRGFKELFGKTAFSYLTEKRMESAEQLLGTSRK